MLMVKKKLAHGKIGYFWASEHTKVKISILERILITKLNMMHKRKMYFVL